MSRDFTPEDIVRPVLVIEAAGLLPGEEKKLLEMLAGCIYGSKQEPNPPERVAWRLRRLSADEIRRLES